MPIVSQFASISHAAFPPHLLLPAPPSRLLLPAPKPSRSTPITITYTHALLGDLDAAQSERLIRAMTTLLDVSVGQMLGLLNMDAFRAAQVAFSREITGENPPRPNTPAGFRAEMDAVLVDHMVRMPRAIADAREQAGREFDAILKKLREASDD
jgi:hypothetical protein